MKLDRVSRFWRRVGSGVAWTAAFAWAFSPGPARACAVCFGDGESLAGFTVSWLFLVLMPFAVVGSIGGWIFLLHRRNASRNSPERSGRPALTQKESGC
jgi:hypothetical protein